MKKLAFVVSVILALGLCGCGKKDAADEIAVPILETKEITYKTCNAEIKDISEEYYQKGQYKYPYSQVVNFKASGQIKSIEVEAPCDVKKGDLLCTLYSDDVDDKIDEEEIRLNQSKQTVATLQSNGASANEIALANFDLQAEQLRYDHLVDSLENYKVYATCDGEFNFVDRHDKQPLNKNTPVNKGETLGYTSDKSKQYLCVEIYDNPLNNVNFGTAVRLEQGANSSTGTVSDIIYNESGDFSTYVYVISPDSSEDLFDFGDVQVVFDVYSRLDTVVIPQKAVKTINERNFVNILIDGVKVEQDVELGISDNENVEVLSGLVGGEELILN